MTHVYRLNTECSTSTYGTFKIEAGVAYNNKLQFEMITLREEFVKKRYIRLNFQIIRRELYYFISYAVSRFRVQIWDNL